MKLLVAEAALAAEVEELAAGVATPESLSMMGRLLLGWMDLDLGRGV